MRWGSPASGSLAAVVAAASQACHGLRAAGDRRARRTEQTRKQLRQAHSAATRQAVKAVRADTRFLQGAREAEQAVEDDRRQRKYNQLYSGQGRPAPSPVWHACEMRQRHTEVAQHRGQKPSPLPAEPNQKLL